MKKKKRKNLLLVSGLLLTILFAGCAKSNKRNESDDENLVKYGVSDKNFTKTNKTLEKAKEEIQSSDNVAIVYDSDDRNINIGIDIKPTQIVLEDGNIILSDNSVGKITDSILIIQKPGTYVISGNLTNGQIIVNSEVDGIVHLIFDGVAITSKNSAPLYIKNSTKTVLTLNKDTSNYLNGNDSYEDDNVTKEDSEGTLFSNSNLTINGSGNLTVTANYKDGITSEEELKIIGANITVKAQEDGIQAKDYVAIESGTLSVVAGGVGLNLPSSEDVALGYAVIDGGTIHIKAIKEGINAGNIIKINNGNVTIKTRETGLYALSNIYIYNGFVSITSLKNGIQGDKSINIVGGEMKINTNDDTSTSKCKGITATLDINILGGDIVIDSLDEAIYSSQLVDIYDGTILIQSGIDGIEGDKFVINGGSLVAVGKKGMTVSPFENNSSQYSVIVTYEKVQKANTLLSIKDEEGNIIVTFEPTKDYQSLVISSNLLKEGVTYSLYTGDNIVKSFEITALGTQVKVE